MSDYRIETDSMGDVKVPTDALYGAQTQRAVDNFKLSPLKLPTEFLQALALVKYCAAEVNQQHAELAVKKADAIKRAALEVYEGRWHDHFPIDVFQTGSGTSSNMNMNEVLSHLAQKEQVEVHPNDDVNRSQSSNDVVPTSIQISAALMLEQQLKPALNGLIENIRNKAMQLTKVTKTGRTHLMDAMPITLAQELETWAHQLGLSLQALEDLQPRLQALPQGGTAVGTGVNAPKEFSVAFAKAVSEFTELEFCASENLFAGISGQELSLQLAGTLNTLAATLLKISNDLRWMNSGPLAGLGEIHLQALQPGSSIMPGKVNPVIPEAVAMVAAQVTGNNATITMAAQSGNFQLNVMLPVIAYNLCQNLSLLSNACTTLGENAIASFEVQQDQLDSVLARNPILVTALNPVIGYNNAAAIAKKAYQQKRPVVDVAAEETDIPRDELEKLLDPKNLT